MNAIQIKFNQFDNDNPHVYAAFRDRALRAVKSGLKKYSAKTIIEVIRWHYDIETKGDELLLNNNYTAYYARKFMDEYPMYRGFFETRSRGV